MKLNDFTNFLLPLRPSRPSRAHPIIQSSPISADLRLQSTVEKFFTPILSHNVTKCHKQSQRPCSKNLFAAFDAPCQIVRSHPRSWSSNSFFLNCVPKVPKCPNSSPVRRFFCGKNQRIFTNLNMRIPRTSSNPSQNSHPPIPALPRDHQANSSQFKPKTLLL